MGSEMCIRDSLSLSHRLELILEWLRLQVPSALYAGYIWDGSDGRRTRPLRDPTAKSYMPTEHWPHDEYPPFASGCGYVISRDLVQRLVSASPSFAVCRCFFSLTHPNSFPHVTPHSSYISADIDLLFFVLLSLTHSSHMSHSHSSHIYHRHYFCRVPDVAVGIAIHQLPREEGAPHTRVVHMDGVRPYRPLPLFRRETIVQHYMQPEEFKQFHQSAYGEGKESEEDLKREAMIADVYELFVKAKVLRR